MEPGQVTGSIHPLNIMGTKIYNSDLTKELREGAKIMTSIDATPSEIAEKVVPVMEVNPKLLRNVKMLVATDTVATSAASPGTAMITTSTTKDTFLTGAYLSHCSDVTCDNIIVRIRTNVNGLAAYLVSIPKFILTAQTDTVYVTFNPPLKLDKGTIVYWLNRYTVGNSSTQAMLFGYEVDTAQV